MKTIFILIFLIPFVAVAQDCGNCKGKPKVSLYEYDVQVPKPAEGDVNSWYDLFRIAPAANTLLINENKNCIYFFQALSILGDGSDKKNVGLQVGGPGWARLPPPGDISQLGPYKYEYIITGFVSGTGIHNNLKIEIQAACSRKIVASTQVSFVNDGNTDLQTVAHNAVRNLSPIVDKIKEFEIKERVENTNIALGNDGGGSRIIIKPKKSKLASGEETEFELTMTDCDGQPLKDREVSFSANNIHGFGIRGTTGGTVKPSTVTTDQFGKAKASFKMGSSGQAMINAHYIFQKPNCNSFAKIGSYPINSVPVVVEIHYIKDETLTITEGSFAGIKSFESGLDIERTDISHFTVLHHYPTEAQRKEGYLVMAPKGEYEPPSKTTYIAEAGTFHYIKKQEELNVTLKDWGANMKDKVGDAHEIEEKGIASLKHPSEVAFFKGSNYEAPYFSFYSNFPNQVKAPDASETIGSDFLIRKGDDGVGWEIKKITDSQSPYKTEYLLTLDLNAAEEHKKAREMGKELLGIDLEAFLATPGKDSFMERQGYTTVTVRILSPYAD